MSKIFNNVIITLINLSDKAKSKLMDEIKSEFDLEYKPNSFDLGDKVRYEFLTELSDKVIRKRFSFIKEINSVSISRYKDKHLKKQDKSRSTMNSRSIHGSSCSACRPDRRRIMIKKYEQSLNVTFKEIKDIC